MSQRIHSLRKIFERNMYNLGIYFKHFSPLSLNNFLEFRQIRLIALIVISCAQHRAARKKHGKYNIRQSARVYSIFSVYGDV